MPAVYIQTTKHYWPVAVFTSLAQMLNFTNLRISGGLLIDRPNFRRVIDQSPVIGGNPLYY